VPGYTWNKSLIADVLYSLASTSKMRYALFYCDRAEITARFPENLNGVLSRVTKNELVGKEDFTDIINRVYEEIHVMLVKIVQKMEESG
jgi:hypothetical protein